MLSRVRNTLTEALRAHPLLTALAASAVVLYVIGLGWGLPLAVTPDRVQAWGSDELAPLGPVAELYSVFLAPAPHTFNPQYPLFHYLVQAVFVAPYAAWLLLTGGLSTPSTTFPFGLADPGTSLALFTVLARVPSVIAGAATVVLAGLTARELTDARHGPLVAGLAVLLLYPMVYYARTSNVDMGALCWTALAIWTTARIVRRGWTPGRAIVLGVAAALATATKDPSYAACLPLGLLLVGRQLSPRREAGGWRLLALALAASVVTYAVASGLVFSPERFRQHVVFVLHGSQPVGLDGQPIESPFYHSNPATLAGYLAVLGQVLTAMRDSIGTPLLLLAAAGMVRARTGWWLLLPAVGVLLGVILPVRFVQLRFVLIIAYVVTLAGAVGIAGFLEVSGRTGRVGVAALVVLALSWNAVRAGDLTVQMLGDARYALADWLEANAAPGDQVGYYGAPRKLPRLGPELATVPMPGQPGYGRFRPTGVDRPAFIVVIPQQSFEGAHEWQLDDATFAALLDGKAGYLPVFAAHGPTIFPHRPITFVNPPVLAFARRDVAEARGLTPVTAVAGSP